jgi:acyl-CoA synthetase (AMP-forming)/AMP-acid ligase II
MGRILTDISILFCWQPTILHLVTPLIAFLVNSPLVTKDDFKSINTVFGGAAPIGSTLIGRLFKKADKVMSFQEGYGMTEMSPCNKSILTFVFSQSKAYAGLEVSSPRHLAARGPCPPVIFKNCGPCPPVPASSKVGLPGPARGQHRAARGPN